jgi:enamine deaminase RidA (YjgF/YER057c/UK114 family)
MSLIKIPSTLEAPPVLRAPDQKLFRRKSPGLELTTIGRGNFSEHLLTLRLLAREQPDGLARRLAEVLAETSGSVVKFEVFGALAAHAPMRDALTQALGELDWPMTWVEGGSCSNDPIAGVQVLAVSGVPVQTIAVNGRIVGRAFDDGAARHCLLGGLGPKQPAASQADQARQTYEHLEAALQQAGMNAAHVVRTWFFLDDILSWYDQFNAVRNEFVARKKLPADALPASTGVSGKNPARAALVASAWALQPRDGSVRVQGVPSPLQCPAPEYGSAFSRALEVSSPHGRRVLVSGTASIAADGHTARLGDARAQIALTMEVVKAILDGRDMTFFDVTRAIAYFKHTADAPAFAEWCTAHGVALLPAVVVQSDICRPELLFEIELDALA